MCQSESAESPILPTLTKATDPDTKYISGRFVPDKNGDSVEIAYEDGTVETTTGKGICIAYSSNELLGSKYRGSDVVVIGQVKKIHGPTNYNGYMMTEGYLELVGPWIVEIPHGCGELAMSLKVGDFVKVPGYISSISTFSTYYTTMDSILVHQQFDEESQSIVPMELYIPEEAE